MNADIQSLLAQAGINEPDPVLEPFASGGNNHVYRVYAGGQVLALKKYKMADLDKRDRLGAEWEFLRSVRNTMLPVPKPLAMDREQGLALYTFIEGRKLSVEEVSVDHVQQAGSFIKRLNDFKVRKLGMKLGNASEAQFSAQGHFEMLQSRLEKVKSFLIDKSFYKTLEDAILIWRVKTESQFKDLGIGVHDDLPTADRCLSPSDFGFHNALEKDGKLTFIDFEYAGWDDPAKLASDFFFQPDVPVDEKYYDGFVDSVLSYVPDNLKEVHKRRIEILRPAFGLKWCCIILNPFDPNWKTGIYGDLDQLRATRFNAAQKLLERLKI